MRFFKYIDGRQMDTYYKKLCFLKFRFWRFGMDGYILKYPPNAHLKKHKDLLEGGKHYRLNIEVRGKGTFYTDKAIFRIGHKLVFFRPDLYEHSMVNWKTERRVLSLGFAWFKPVKKVLKWHPIVGLYLFITALFSVISIFSGNYLGQIVANILWLVCSLLLLWLKKVDDKHRQTINALNNQNE